MDDRPDDDTRRADWKVRARAVLWLLKMEAAKPAVEATPQASPLANLRPTAKSIADYITAHPGSTEKEIANGCGLGFGDGSVRKTISKDLRPIGFTNRRGGAGYFPPSH